LLATNVTLGSEQQHRGGLTPVEMRGKE
jgi:hypothetical protein